MKKKKKKKEILSKVHRNKKNVNESWEKCKFRYRVTKKKKNASLVKESQKNYEFY